jgi:hypothetical protein
VLPQLSPLLARGIIAYNAPYDVRMLAASLRRLGVSWALTRTACALQAFTGYRASVGVPQPGPGATLGDACAQFGIRRGGAHRELDDARAALALLRAMAGEELALRPDRRDSVCMLLRTRGGLGIPSDEREGLAADDVLARDTTPLPAGSGGRRVH